MFAFHFVLCCSEENVLHILSRWYYINLSHKKAWQEVINAPFSKKIIFNKDSPKRSFLQFDIWQFLSEQKLHKSLTEFQNTSFSYFRTSESEILAVCCLCIRRWKNKKYIFKYFLTWVKPLWKHHGRYPCTILRIMQIFEYFWAFCAKYRWTWTRLLLSGSIDKKWK